jgi:predicted Zn-dependent peptidase
MGELKQYEIAKGITLNTITSDKFKTNYLSVNFLRPLSKEEASLSALLPMVLKRGCAALPNMKEIGRELDLLYGAKLEVQVRKKGEVQIAGLSLAFLDDGYALEKEDISGRAVALLCDIFLHPLVEDGGFKKEYVESEKKNLADLIEAQINDKRTYAMNRCYEEMCKDEAFGVSEYGQIEAVRAITAESLYRYYKSLINSAKIEFFYIGKAPERIAKTIKPNFLDIERVDPAELKTLIVKKSFKVREVVEELPVAQGKLSLGFRTGIAAGDKEFPALQLMSAVYGGGPTSRLFMNVRERLSLCYYCASRLERIKGVMLVFSGIEVAQKERAQAEILAQLEAVKGNKFTDEELEAARMSLINSYKSIQDSMAGLEDWYLGQIASGSIQSLDDAARNIAEVSREEVVRAAQTVTLDTIYFLKGNA